MASTLQRGSTGSQVKKMQNMLSQAGMYTGQASGTYDDATAQAVSKYQQSVGLNGNGVFDNNTLQKLYGTLQSGQSAAQTQQNTPAAAPAQQPVQTTPSATGDTAAQLQRIAQGYQPSAEVTQARQTLSEAQANRPANYQSAYEPMINDLFNQIVNRKPFSYDVNGDALYSIYKDQYVKGGRMAMEDTMGRAAQLTGGYGNSYAQQVGQQTYDEYLTRLADKVPELEAQAYARYQAEGDRMRDQLGLAMDREAQDYSRWGDDYDRWMQNLQYATDRADTADQLDYNRWADDRDYWANREQTEYNRSDAQISQQRETAYNLAMQMLQNGTMPGADTLARAGIDQADAQAYADMLYQQAQAQAAAAAKSSGGGGRGGSSKSSSGKQVGDEQIDQAMKLYQNNPDSVVPYLERLEYQGYDTEWLADYLAAYGGVQNNNRQSGIAYQDGRVVASNLEYDENDRLTNGKVFTIGKIPKTRK